MKENIQIRCHVCDQKVTMTVDPQRFNRWREQEGHIQDLLYDLSPGERELLISGTCEKCFDRIAKDVDD